MENRMQLATRTRLDALKVRAADAAALMRLLANEKRLLVLCMLAQGGEMCVGELAEEVGLDQSPLSQHLAKLREEGLVATRRQAQTIFYRIAKPEVLRVLKLLKEIYCP
jgi:DNA-binding transcriptional ArsR family regulator